MSGKKYVPATLVDMGICPSRVKGEPELVCKATDEAGNEWWVYAPISHTKISKGESKGSTMFVEKAKLFRKIIPDLPKKSTDKEVYQYIVKEKPFVGQGVELCLIPHPTKPNQIKADAIWFTEAGDVRSGAKIEQLDDDDLDALLDG
jgi:hypothetical protein